MTLAFFIGVLAPGVSSMSASAGMNPASAALETLRCGKRR